MIILTSSAKTRIRAVRVRVRPIRGRPGSRSVFDFEAELRSVLKIGRSISLRQIMAIHGNELAEL